MNTNLPCTGLNGETSGTHHSTKDLLLIFAVGVLVGFPNLGQERNWAAREVRHALIVAEMAESGDYLVPTLHGQEYFYKQTVMHAPAALLCRLTGFTSMLWARTPSALAGILGACALYGIGLAWYGRRAALLAALMLLGIPGYAIIARTARPDMVFTAALTVMCLGLVRCVAGPAGWRSAGWLILAGIAAGFALLSKGPYGIFYIGLFSVGTLVCTWVCRPELRLPRIYEILIFNAAFLAIPLAWGLAVYLRDDGAYLRKVLSQYTPSDEHLRPVYWYMHRAAVLVLPWTFFLPWVAAAFVRAAPETPEAGLRGWLRKIARDPATIFALVVFCALSIVRGKRDHYLGPWYPFAMLTIAPILAAHWEQLRWRRSAIALLAVSLSAVPIYATIVQPYVLKETNPERELCLKVVAAVADGSTVVCYQNMGAEVSFVAHCQGRAKAFQVQQIGEALEPFAKQMREVLAQGQACYLVIRERDLQKTLYAAKDLKAELILEYGIKDEDKETKYHLYRIN